MDERMETNKWLWQPHKNGSIYLRLSYRDFEGNRKTFTRALGTKEWPEACRIQDVEFSPIILGYEQGVGAT